MGEPFVARVRSFWLQAAIEDKGPGPIVSDPIADFADTDAVTQALQGWLAKWDAFRKDHPIVNENVRFCQERFAQWDRDGRGEPFPVYEIPCRDIPATGLPVETQAVLGWVASQWEVAEMAYAVPSPQPSRLAWSTAVPYRPFPTKKW